MKNIAGNEKTFYAYANNMIFPIVKSELIKVRVDLVFDTYRENSLKSTARAKRGEGIRRKVESNFEPPKKWRLFLRINDNKAELFRFLSKSAIPAASGDMNVFCAFDDTVICNKEYDLNMVAPCSQEEVDTRLWFVVGIALRK